MVRNSALYRSLCTAWDLVCDRSLPKSFRAVYSENVDNDLEDFNPLYFIPLWGAAAGLLALAAGRIISAVLPVNGSAVLFALLSVIFSEIRTSGRGLALNVTLFSALFENKTFYESRQLRCASLKNISGLIPLLLAIILLGGKFFAVVLIARTGHFGIAAAAWIIALSAEGILAADEYSVGVPAYCQQAKGSYIAATGGFLMLFNFVFLPLPTLIAVSAAAAITIVMLVLLRKRIEEISSDDMTSVGYLQEFAVLAIYAILIG